MDTQWSLTHIAAIFKFGDVSGPRAKKWPKVNRGLKIVNYFTCMRHFSCRWYGPPEVDLNWYPRICNPYYCDIQIRRCEWTQGKIMTQSKSQIKGSKGSIGGYPPHILTICGTICGSSGPRAKKWPKVNRRLKEVKEVLVATHHTFTTTYFDNMRDNMWVQFFLGKKLMNIFDIIQKYS